MSEDVAVQASFNAGEWSPNLFARVDIQKYRSAAALMRNWYVDYRGGASTRPGTKYVIQAYDSLNPVRLIPFQASTYVGYIIEIGNGYMRFIYNGTPVLSDPTTISGITRAAHCAVSIGADLYAVFDWVYISGVTGMPEINGRFFMVKSTSPGTITLGTLDGNYLDSTAYHPYLSGGFIHKVYTIKSPYGGLDDLRQIKYAQSVNQMVLCHPNHPAYVLTLNAANDWSLSQATFAATVNPPTGVTIASSLGAGATWNYAYQVTSIDAGGQESSPSTAGTISTANSLRTTAGTNQVTWAAAPGAVAYNIYEAELSTSFAIPAGAPYGFIGTTRGTTFIDSNIGPDFTQTPPIAQDPFTGASIDHVIITAPGVYTTVPKVSFSGAATVPATGIVQLEVQGTPVIGGVALNYAVGDSITFPNGVVVNVTAVAAGAPTAWTVVNPGVVDTGSTPTNPMAQVSTSGSGTGVTATATWGVGAVVLTNAGGGFLSAPTVVFSAGAAAATAPLALVNGNPTVPGFVQQRLFLGGLVNHPATFYMSQPGQYFNFNTSDPITAVDAVNGTLVSGSLNSIKSIVASFAGMLVLTDKAVWLVNGGSPGSAITPLNVVANPQSFVGANDVPPIVANNDILYVQAKGTAVRDIAYNFYTGTFASTDISIMASHMFYNYEILEWAWAEQPYYLAQAVRSDGILLTLTYLKEQEFVGWTTNLTQGFFYSVASVTETVGDTSVDAVYVIVQRNIQGIGYFYIERFAERSFATAADSWCVDAGIGYNGVVAATTFVGAEHLAGETVVGLADGVPITPFVMPANGIFTLPTPAYKVTVGLQYICYLQTLPLDIGEPSIQGKVKKIQAVDIRVKDTLGLKIGSVFANAVPMKDLVVGNVSSTLTGQNSQVVSDLVTGDAKTILDPTYTVPGQFAIMQDNPYPATVLGVFPQFVTEDRRG